MTTPNQKNDSSERVIRDMSGYIARNDRRTNDRQPHWRGKVTVQGKEYFLSLWERDENLMSLSMTDPDTLPPRPNQNQGQQGQIQNQGQNQSQQAQSQQSSTQGQSKYPSEQAQPPVSGDPFGDIFTP